MCVQSRDMTQATPCGQLIYVLTPVFVHFTPLFNKYFCYTGTDCSRHKLDIGFLVKDMFKQNHSDPTF